MWNAFGPLVAAREAGTLRTRRSPRVAIASDVTFVTPRSAIARIVCDRGIRGRVGLPAFTTPTTIFDS